MRAKFQPKVLSTLRPHMLALVGYEAEWDLSGQADEGPYAGQEIYHMSRDDPRYHETKARWVPQADLCPL